MRVFSHAYFKKDTDETKLFQLFITRGDMVPEINKNFFERSVISSVNQLYAWYRWKLRKTVPHLLFLKSQQHKFVSLPKSFSMVDSWTDSISTHPPRVL